MRLAADWVSDPATRQVTQALSDAGHGVWFVGGCVRNTLLQVAVSDIDITTDARPERVMELAKAAGIKAVPTGVDHGTVTLVADHKPFEITTLRRDVTTDGRRATVAFTDQLHDDAARRDFTMNALYATPTGEVIDPLAGGIADLAARRVCFIGNADDRIREDYLRILRFFRFHAWYGDPDAGLDADGLAACAGLADGLASLSKERTGAEMKKLLLAPDPSPAVAAMAQSGVLARVLPGADARVLPVLVHLERDVPDAMRRLASLGGERVAERLRLSKAERTRLDVLRREMEAVTPAAELGYRHGAEIAKDVLVLRAASLGTGVGEMDLAQVDQGAQAVFPITAADLMPTLSGAALGRKLAELEALWVASDFAKSKTDLLRNL